jgi:hypothetical protein
LFELYIDLDCAPENAVKTDEDVTRTMMTIDRSEMGSSKGGANGYKKHEKSKKRSTTPCLGEITGCHRFIAPTGLGVKQ